MTCADDVDEVRTRRAQAHGHKRPWRSSSRRASAGSENSNCTVVPATLCTDFTGSNDVRVLSVSMHNNYEQLALR